MENSDHRSNEMSVFSSGFNVNKSWSPGTFGRPVPTDNNQYVSQGQRWQPQQQNATYGQDTYKRDHWQSQSQQQQPQSQSQYGNQRYDQRGQQSQQQYNNGRQQHQSYEKQSYGQQYGQDKQYGSSQGQSSQYGQQDQRQQHHQSQSSYNQRGGGQQQWGDRSYGNRPQYRQHGGGGYQRDRGNGYQQHRNYDQRQQRRPYQDYRKPSYGNQNSPVPAWKQHSRSGWSAGKKEDWEYDSRYYDDGPKKTLEELTTLQNTSIFGNLTHEQQSEVRRMQPSHPGHGRNLRKTYLENVERRRPNQPKGALDMRLFLKFGTLDVCQTQEANADDLVHCCSKSILDRQVKDNVEVMHKRKHMQGWQPGMPEMNPSNMGGVEQKLLALLLKHCDAKGFPMTDVASPLTDVVKQRHAQQDPGQLWTEIRAEIGEETIDHAMRPMLDQQSPYKM